MQTKKLGEDGVAREAFARLAAAADEFEGYAHPHAERIAALSSELAKLFGLGSADRASLRLAALAHDLGEMLMKRDYIRRAAPLTFEERLDLARHPVIGEQEAARAGADRGAQLLVRWHQEWWNGAGYPDALARERIPLAARILRVADAYASLTDARPYRPAFSEADARKHLTEWAGLEFDPQVVRAFLTLKNLPALRSYATQAEDAPAVVAATTRDETASAASGDRADEWNTGSHVPERDTNPYANSDAQSAQHATLEHASSSDAAQLFNDRRDTHDLDSNRNADSNQNTDSTRNADSLTKADTEERHA